MAHALTTIRLLLATPVAVGHAKAGFVDPWLLFGLIWVAIATDYADGRVARLTGTASANGQLFDHATDFVFVTAGLAGAAATGVVTAVLPVLICLAFGQYVFDSYVLDRRKQLRMSTIGRWNGIFYFVLLLVIAGSRLPLLEPVAPFLVGATVVITYGLVTTTIVSIIDRTMARPDPR